MKKVLAVTAMVLVAGVVLAAPMRIDLGGIKFEDAEKPAALKWLATKPNLYTNGIEVVEGATNTVKMLVTETPQEKLERCMRADARQFIRGNIDNAAAVNAAKATKKTKRFDEAP